MEKPDTKPLGVSEDHSSWSSGRPEALTATSSPCADATDENDENLGIDWSDPDEAPEWTDDQFDRAEFAINGVVIRPAKGTLTKPGRPPSANPKRQVTLRLDGAVLDKLRSSGPGWQTRVNDILRKAVGV